MTVLIAGRMQAGTRPAKIFNRREGGIKDCSFTCPGNLGRATSFGRAALLRRHSTATSFLNGSKFFGARFRSGSDAFHCVRRMNQGGTHSIRCPKGRINERRPLIRLPKHRIRVPSTRNRTRPLIKAPRTRIHFPRTRIKQPRVRIKSPKWLILPLSGRLKPSSGRIREARLPGGLRRSPIGAPRCRNGGPSGRVRRPGGLRVLRTGPAESGLPVA